MDGFEEQYVICIQINVCVCGGVEMADFVSVQQKRRGPSTEPCWTPDLTGSQQEEIPLRTTH